MCRTVILPPLRIRSRRSCKSLTAPSYVSYTHSEMEEWEFLGAIAKRADCLILLDINNVYVSAFNHGFDALEYLESMSVERVWQIHLAGHLNLGDTIIDTHDDEIIEPVWRLYEAAVRRFGTVATMIERDDNIPALEVSLKELEMARRIAVQTGLASWQAT